MSFARSGSLSKTSSCSSLRTIRSKSSRLEVSNEKHTPDLPKRTQELFRVTHCLPADGVLRADFWHHVLQRHQGNGALQLSIPDDGPAAADERERNDHPPAARLRFDHHTVPDTDDYHASDCRGEAQRHYRAADDLSREGYRDHHRQMAGRDAALPMCARNVDDQRGDAVYLGQARYQAAAG